jgi:hypothetical protein
VIASFIPHTIGDIMLSTSASFLKGSPSLARTVALPLRLVAGLVVALAFVLGPTMAWAAVPPVVVAAEAPIGASAVTSAQGKTGTATATEAQGYAAREAQAKPLENFNGGDTTIILAW